MGQPCARCFIRRTTMMMTQQLILLCIVVTTFVDWVLFRVMMIMDLRRREGLDSKGRLSNFVMGDWSCTPRFLLLKSIIIITRNRTQSTKSYGWTNMWARWTCCNRWSWCWQQEVITAESSLNYTNHKRLRSTKVKIGIVITIRHSCNLCCWVRN